MIFKPKALNTTQTWTGNAHVMSLYPARKTVRKNLRVQTASAVQSALDGSLVAFSVD